jgi:ketosteroid isomerase-like protein
MSKLTSNVNSDVSIDEIVSAGECRLVLGRTRGRALTTNKDFDVQIVHIYTFDEENKITKVDFYIDTPAMLEAL